jgi:putative addiction module killer protein
VSAQPRQIEIYVGRDNKAPFEAWLRKLKDRDARARIQARIARLRLGNPGDCKSAGGGVYELRVDYGPGYRVYFAQVGSTIILLLCGGDKRTQQPDIKKARQYLEDFQQRSKEEDE